MNIITLAELALFPGTHDKDRYARTIRQELRVAMEGASPAPLMVLQGTLRLIDRRDPVPTNQQRLKVALDTICALDNTRWRRDTTITADGEVITRKAHLFANPTLGAELLSKNIVSAINTTCMCITHPEAMCFANVHTI